MSTPTTAPRGAPSTQLTVPFSSVSKRISLICCGKLREFVVVKRQIGRLARFAFTPQPLDPLDDIADLDIVRHLQASDRRLAICRLAWQRTNLPDRPDRQGSVACQRPQICADFAGNRARAPASAGRCLPIARRPALHRRWPPTATGGNITRQEQAPMAQI